MQGTGPLERRWWKGKGVTLKHVKEALIELLVTRYHYISFSLSLSHSIPVAYCNSHTLTHTYTLNHTHTHVFFEYHSGAVSLSFPIIK